VPRVNPTTASACEPEAGATRPVPPANAHPDPAHPRSRVLVDESPAVNPRSGGCDTPVRLRDWFVMTAAAALRAVTGEPERSQRYRRFVRPLGFHDELRAVLRAGCTPWGALTLWRRPGRPAFSARETDLIVGLSEPIGEALRVRGELVAKLFAEYYEPVYADHIVRVLGTEPA
jgi:hypothetical protein